MNIVICGDGRLGWAVAEAAHERGDRARVLGRPGTARHDPESFSRADVVVEASTAEALLANVHSALDAGVQRLVIATTGWQGELDAVEAALTRASAAAVVAPNLSVGAAVFVRLVESAAESLAGVSGFETFIWEWHRRGKADRPSGTAREIARRLALADPRAGNVDVVSIRAGASPGVHVVGFDAPGETIELRISARDRSCYAAGALVAADWLHAAQRPPGLHAFEVVVSELLDGVPLAASA